MSQNIQDAIRLVADHDAEQIREIYSPYVRDTFITFETEPPDVQEIHQRLRKTSERWPWLVCESSGRVLGYAYASEHRSRAAYQWSVDVTVYVRKENHRAGIGRSLYTALFSLLRRQGYFNAYAGIALPNQNSVGLHESMGFKPVGVYQGVGYKLGGWRDVGWWHLPLQNKQAQPEAPLSIKDLVKNSNLKTILADSRRGFERL